MPTPPRDAAEVSPPRFRWLARIAITYVVLAAALAVLTYAWARRGERIHDGLLAQWRAEGAVASAAEINARLDARSSPAARDAGTRLLAAATQLEGRRNPRALPTRTPAEQAAAEALSRWQDDYDRRVPAASRDVGHLRSKVAAAAAELEEIEALLDGREIDWGTRYRSPLMSTLLPYLNTLRQVGTMLGDAAALAHADGDDATAVRRLAELATLADAIERPPTPLVVFQVAGGVRFELCSRVESIAATLRANHDGSAGAAKRGDVAALIARLLDERPRRAALIAALQFERLQSPFDAIENMRPQPAAWAFSRPMLRQQYAEPAARVDRAIRAVDAPTLAAAEAMLPPEPKSDRSVARLPRRAIVMRDLIQPGIWANTQNAHRNAARRRAAATLLAMRLFELDRRRLPQALAELVPAYLPAVPLDTAGDVAVPLWYVNEGDLVAIYVPGRPRASPQRPPATRPKTFTRDLWTDRARRSDVVVTYRGHGLVKRPAP